MGWATTVPAVAARARLLSTSECRGKKWREVAWREAIGQLERGTKVVRWRSSKICLDGGETSGGRIGV